MQIKIGVIGLGYVGLPLARLLATKYKIVGFDINKARIKELKLGIDKTLEVTKKQLLSVLKNEPEDKNGIYFTTDKKDLSSCNYYIVTVPTPIDKHNRPDLTPLIKASELVGEVLKDGDIVIYESTVYPGVTEFECVPILEKVSKLKFNVDFYVGYSPERINPGDKEHTVDKILKVTSGSTPETAIKVDNLYKSVITAGTHLAPSIMVAESAKIIENSQRDINIAFVNELAKIFNLMDINTSDVLEAASTKWNFLPFKPGLVGGHCIGVDPYYLAQKAQELGYHPDIILSGRRMNDSMGLYVTNKIIKLLVKKNIKVKGSDLLILGITFKENCPDVRNTKVVDVVLGLQEFGVNIVIYDPWANIEDVKKIYNLTTVNKLPNDKTYDGIVLAVAHDEFLKLKINNYLKKDGVIYDIKGKLNCTVDGEL